MLLTIRHGIRSTSLSLAFFTALTTAAARPQVSPAAIPKTPDAQPNISSVIVFPQAAATSQAAATQDFLLEINGTNFAEIDLSKVYIAVFPATGVTPNPIPALSRSLDNSKILAQFTAPANYVLEGIALSTASGLFPFNTGMSACDFPSKVKLIPQTVPKDQTGNKYGNGVAKNFYAIQISIVNECPMAIVVPLAGITIVPNGRGKDEASKDATTKNESPKDVQTKTKADRCSENGILVAFSLDHVTSIYSSDRKLTGRRAIYFNTVQALATLGSAIEPFFASGFTKGVSILGGGFTTASKELLVDMSAEQLQNLTSQSFGSTEQVAAHGSLQKFVFVRRNDKCKDSGVETALRTGDFSVRWELSPASTVAPKPQTASAKATE